MLLTKNVHLTGISRSYKILRDECSLFAVGVSEWTRSGGLAEQRKLWRFHVCFWLSFSYISCNHVCCQCCKMKRSPVLIQLTLARLHFSTFSVTLASLFCAWFKVWTAVEVLCLFFINETTWRKFCLLPRWLVGTRC